MGGESRTGQDEPRADRVAAGAAGAGGAGAAAVSPRAAPAAPRRGAGVLLPMLALSVFLPATSQSLLIPAVPELMRAHEATADDTAWVLTAFLIVASVAAPVGGRLGVIYGRRRAMLAMLTAFVAGSLVCALADSLAPLIAGRLLQGCVGGTFVLAFALARDTATPERARASVALMSVVVGFGTGAGFALGGIVVEHLPFAAAFWGAAAIGAVALAYGAVVLPREPVPPRDRLDVLGATLLVVGAALPLVAVSQANRWGWTAPLTLVFALVGALLLFAWWRVEQRRGAQPAGEGAAPATEPSAVAAAAPHASEALAGAAAPGAPPRVRARPAPQALIDTDALSARPVLLGNLATLLLGCGMFGLFVLTPQLVQQDATSGAGLGLGAATAGLVLAPGALTMLLVGPLATRAGRRLGDHAALALGAGTTALGLALLAGVRGSAPVVVAWVVLAAVGLGIAMPAMPALVAGAVPYDRVADAVGFNAMLRGGGSAVGAQVSAAILSSTVVAGGLPTSGGYAAAYAFAAGCAAAGAVVALAIGGRRSAVRGRRVHARRRGGRRRAVGVGGRRR